MDRFPQQILLLFRPEDETLTSAEKTQVQTCRLISLLGAIVLTLIGLLRFALPLDTGDPTWASFGVAGLLLGLYATTYVSEAQRRRSGSWTQGGLYAVMGWAVAVVVLNQATGEYVLGLVLVYAVLVGAVGLSGGSVRSVWWFAGVGLLLAAAGFGLGPSPRTHPLAVLASMALAGAWVGIATHASLSRREDFRKPWDRKPWGRWQHPMENLREAVIITAGDEVAYANAQATMLFGKNGQGTVGDRSGFGPVAAEARENIRNRLEGTEGGQSTEVYEHRVSSRDGEEHVVQSQSVPVQYEGRDATLTVVHNGTQEREDRDTPSQRTGLESLIVEISAGFIDTPARRIDQAIEVALGTVGSFVEADRSYVFLFDGDPEEDPLDETTQSNMHEWCAEGIPPQKDNLQDIPCSAIPWWTEQMCRKEPLIIPSVADLPEAAAAEQEILEAQDIQSLAVLPMTQGERLVGYVGFDAVRSQVEWDEETVTILRVLSDAISSALHRQEMEEKLREREERLRAITENVSEGIYRSTADEGLVYANQTFAEMFGYDHVEDVLEIDPTALYATPEDRERLRDAAQEQDSFDGVEAEFQRADGTTFIGLMSGSIVRDQDGNVRYYDGAITDITARKRREGKLRRQNDLFAMAQDLASVGALEYDVRDDELTWTDEVYRIHGLPKSFDPTLESVIERYHPEDRPRYRDMFERAVQEGEPFIAELRLFTQAGEQRWVRTRMDPQASDGEIVRVRGSIQDITERKRRERALKETNATLEAILENLPLGVLAEDASRSVLTANEDFCTLLGLPCAATDLTGRDAATVTRQTAGLFADSETFTARTQEILDQGEPVFDEEFTLADGRVLERDFVPYELEDGTAGLWVYRDVTERKERERRLRVAKDEAQEANRMKSVFLANMSHEIRTPLTSIIGFAEAIGDEVEEGREGPIPHFAGLIEESGRRLLETLDAVLNLSKLEAGEMELSPEPISVAEEVEEMAELFGPRAEEEGIDLQIDAPSDTPWVRADPGGLRIVLRNLVSNALKYTEEGGCVWLRTRPAEKGAAIEVEDTGIGMDPEDASSLFEAFRQGSEGMARQYEGSGLGLAVTKRVIDGMDGAIEVETEKGAGTCFTVRLPPGRDGES